MAVESKTFVFRGIALRTSYFDPPVKFWSPRNTPGGSQGKFSEPVAKFC